MLSLSPASPSLPPSPILFVILLFDVIFPFAWRSYLPDFLGNPETGYMGKYRPLDCMIRWYSKNHLTTFSEFRNGADADLGMVVKFMKADNTVLGDLCSMTSLVVVLPILVVIMRSIKRHLEPRFSMIGRQLGRSTYGTEWEKHNEDRIIKFGEYVFRLCYHSTVSVWGLYYVVYLHHDWWTNPKLFTQNHPCHTIENQMIWYYYIQCAYNIEALIRLMELSFEIRNPLRTGWKRSVTWAKTVRGDFREMCIHHIATNALVMLSSSFALTRIGSAIMLLHDVSDIPVDMSKLANFVKWKKTTIVCFVIMCFVWLVTRLGIFPLVMIRSIMFDFPLLTSEDSLEPEAFYSVYWIFIIFVFVILALHCTWFAMLLKIGYLLLRKGETHDLSEHKQGEKPHNLYVTEMKQAKKMS